MEANAQSQPIGLSAGISAEPPASAPPAAPTTDNDFVDNPSYKASAANTQDNDFVDNPNYKPAKPSELTVQPGDSALTKTGKVVGGLFSGIGEGIFSTAAGAADIAHAPQKARELLHTLAGDNEQKSNSETIGYGGETLAEFLLGDEALKALPMAKRLEVAAKTMKTVESSPRLVNALKVGTKILKLSALHGTEAGITQAAQTAIRTPGTIEQKAEEGAKEGAETAAGATVLGAPLEAVGEGLQKAGQVAGKVKNLSDVAEGSKGKEEVVQELSNRIKGSKAQMNTDFEAGINDLKTRLKGSDISAQDNPMATKAKELLAKPNPEEHPLVVAAKNAAGDKLDKSVNNLLDMASKGTIPVEAEEGAQGAAPTPTILDANGNPVKSKTDLTPMHETPLPNYTVDDLVKFRQTIRSLADSYDLGDINARVLRKLNNSVDDTIGKLAEQSNDPTALSDYQKLRANYRDKVNLFDDPVIEKLHDGKVDDAARFFVGLQKSGSALPSAGKTVYNTDVLKRVIGDDGVKAFGKDVFGTMLKDSMENGRINPAKFAQSWDRITEQTKGDLFNINDATNGLAQLAKDAHSAETLQHLTRLGVLGTAGATAGGFIHPLGMGLGTLLGLTVAEGGGIAAGRDLLNYIANHPKVWAAYEGAGKIAAKSTGTVPATASYIGTKAVNSNKVRPKNQSLNDSLQSASGVLQ